MQHTKGQASEEMQHYKAGPPGYKIKISPPPTIFDVSEKDFNTSFIISRIYLVCNEKNLTVWM